MYKIEISKRALNSIENTICYIADDNVFYANQVQEYIYKSIKLLETFPFIGVLKGKDYRVIVEKKYKFKIIYKVIGKNILVIGLYREQKSWK